MNEAFLNYEPLLRNKSRFYDEINWRKILISRDCTQPDIDHFENYEQIFGKLSVRLNKSVKTINLIG